MLDWQTIAAALVVLAACAYVARRAWARLRSFRGLGGRGVAASCATGCGKCGDEGGAVTPTARPLVQIGRAKDAGRRAGRGEPLKR